MSRSRNWQTSHTETPYNIGKPLSVQHRVSVSVGILIDRNFNKYPFGFKIGSLLRMLSNHFYLFTGFSIHYDRIRYWDRGRYWSRDNRKWNELLTPSFQRILKKRFIVRLWSMCGHIWICVSNILIYCLWNFLTKGRLTFELFQLTWTWINQISHSVQIVVINYNQYLPAWL